MRPYLLIGRLLLVLLLTRLLAGVASPATAIGPQQGGSKVAVVTVTFENGDPVTGAPVRFFDGDPDGGTVINTLSNGQASYALPLGSYRIDVLVEHSGDVPWMYTGPPETFRFRQDDTAETLTRTLRVATTTATVIGRVVLADGFTPLPLPPFVPGVEQPTVEAFGERSASSRQAVIASTGAFTLPLVTDVYELVFNLDDSYYSSFDPPRDIELDVVAGTIDLGDLPVLPRDAVIQGTVTDGGSPVGGAYVEAIGESGAYAATSTDGAGAFSLAVSAGAWEVTAEPDPEEGYVDFGVSELVSITSGTTVTLALTIPRAAAILEGTLVDEAGAAVSGVSGWAYARAAASGEYVAFDTVQAGTFALNVPAGDLRVGVILEPGSSYSLLQESSARAGPSLVAPSGHLSGIQADALERAPYEQAVWIAPGQVSPAQVTLPITVRLAANTATIEGRLILPNGEPLTGVEGLVIAAPHGIDATWQFAPIDPDTGSFSLGVAAGTWLLSYELEINQSSRLIAPSPLRDTLVLVGPNQTSRQDLAVPLLDYVVAGTVTNEAGTPVPGIIVWVASSDYEAFTLTDANGNYEVFVPGTNEQGRALSYTVSITYDCTGKPVCYLSSPPVPVEPIPIGGAGVAQTPRPGDIVAREADLNVDVIGVVRVNGNGRAGVSVYSQRRTGGRQTSATVQSLSSPAGQFTTSIPVDLDSGTISVRVFAGFTDSQGRLYSGKVDATPTIRAAGITQTEPPGADLAPVATLPPAVVSTFTAATGWSHTLADGTRIAIPPGAVPVGGNAQVRVVVEAAPLLRNTSAHDLATYYGYTISLFDAGSGRRLNEPLLRPALMELRYSDDHVWANDVAEGRLRPARLVGQRWAIDDNFIISRGANRLSLQSVQLGTWGLIQVAGQGCGSCVFVPLLHSQ